MVPRSYRMGHIPDRNRSIQLMTPDDMRSVRIAKAVTIACMLWALTAVVLLAI
jgi:hypothetical protein